MIITRKRGYIGTQAAHAVWIGSRWLVRACRLQLVGIGRRMAWSWLRKGEA